MIPLSHRTCRALTATIFLLFLASCASGPATTETEPTETMPGVEEIELSSVEEIQQRAPLTTKFDNIVIREFETTDELQRGYPNALMQCKTAILSQLKSKNAYKTVTEDKAAKLTGKSLLVDLKIVDMRIASGAARFWGGALAGASYMKILTRLTDQSTGQLVHEKILTSTTNPFGAAWTMGASDRSLPVDFGQMVGEYLYTIVPSSS
jgi:hypothetical protein